MKNWIQSYSGKKVTPLRLEPGQVDIGSIAHSLAMKTRFTGHCIYHYSVAQHCVLGSEKFTEPRLALAFLLHEVSEAYLPDIASPIKEDVFVRIDGVMLSWRELERRHADAVFTALGLEGIRPLIDSPEIHEADARMLVTEAGSVMGLPPEPWGYAAAPYLEVGVQPWAPRDAEIRFHARFAELIREVR